jgi:hypothetical protein
VIALAAIEIPRFPQSVSTQSVLARLISGGYASSPIFM